MAKKNPGTPFGKLADLVADKVAERIRQNPSAANPDDVDASAAEPELSAKALEQLHAAHRAGMLDDDVLDELCPGDDDCPDADDDNEDE